MDYNPIKSTISTGPWLQSQTVNVITGGYRLGIGGILLTSQGREMLGGPWCLLRPTFIDEAKWWSSTWMDHNLICTWFIFFVWGFMLFSCSCAVSIHEDIRLFQLSWGVWTADGQEIWGLCPSLVHHHEGRVVSIGPVSLIRCEEGFPWTEVSEDWM